MLVLLVPGVLMGGGGGGAPTPVPQLPTMGAGQ